MAPSWSTPADIRAQVQRRWDSGQFVAAHLEDKALYPRVIRISRPSTAELSSRFDAVRDWMTAIEKNAKPNAGYGYTVTWREVQHQQLGKNKLIDKVYIDTEHDALRLIDKRRAHVRLICLVDATCARFPALRALLIKRPRLLMENADCWPQILDVLGFFKTHPRPGLYLRTLEIPGVDTKFVETRMRLFIPLLDAVVPPTSIDHDATGRSGFLRRYGLATPPHLVRLRALDPAIRFGGLSDIAARPSELSAIDFGATRAVITENAINGLTFPETTGGVVIFGLGYGLESLRDISWLQQVELRYWGDIDTHGFAMLDRAREMFPHVRSLLMDKGTFQAHRRLWVTEDGRRRTRDELTHLTDAEWQLYDDLRHDRVGRRVRLEQERIAYTVVRQACEKTWAEPDA